jgi:P-type conjugative transfer protein TrbG
MSPSRRIRPLSFAAGGAVAFSVLAAVAAWAQAPLGPQASTATPPPAAATSAAAAVAQPPASPPAPPPAPKPKPLPPLPGAKAVASANAAARSYPTPEAYLNATLFYDFEVGRLYQVQTSPRFLTAIMLRPGEKLLAKASGDTVRWVLGETEEGVGPNAQVVVLLKPIRGGLRTNIVLTTDQRTYLIEAASREGGTYTSAVSWNYPQEQMQALAAAQAAAEAAQVQKAAVVVAPALAIDQLHFGYKVEPLKGKAPRWQPLRVFDDGTKTYIQFPVNMAATDAPPLFLVGPHDSAELVNYHYINGYYVVDRLIDVAELRIGEKPQSIVRITRTGERG